MSALVELRAASAALNGVTVFEALDFRLEAGESGAIVGANGSGKTTLLRLLAGELWPTPVEARTFDMGDGPTWSPLRARQKIAFVSPLAQERAVRLAQGGAEDERGARLSVRECIATGFFDSFLLHQAPDTVQEEQMTAMIARFGLLELAERELQTLSQGQLRRVLLARALVKAPRLVLLDEAASGLDALARAELFAALGQLAQSGTSFVFASHRAQELPEWAEGWTLREGRLTRAMTNVGTVLAPSFVQLTERTKQTPFLRKAPIAPLFTLQNVSVFLDGAPVLLDLNWQWPRGVHLRVGGDNGAGKSTFLRLLGGELVPAHGGAIVRLGEERLRPVWEWRRRIALVSPHLQARFHEPLTVREAVASGFMGGFVAPTVLETTQTEALEEALDEWELRPLAARRFDRLSFGQTRRVLLARALVTRPEVVLLDEAHDGLDAGTRDFCLGKWAELARAGVHFAFASHHPEDFPAWATGEVTLRGGRLV